jgi:hypothetical protein
MPSGGRGTYPLPARPNHRNGRGLIMRNRKFARLLQPDQRVRASTELGDGARVAVMRGGPTGSFFSYFLLDLANRLETGASPQAVR